MKASIRVDRRASGSYSIQINVTAIRPIRCRGGRFYEVLDIDCDAPIQMDFDGIPMNPRLIVRLYKKVPRVAGKVLDRRRRHDFGITIPKAQEFA